MGQPGNPNLRSLSGVGTSPHIKVHMNDGSKALLESWAKDEGKPLSQYCRDILESHVDARLEKEM